MDIDTPDLPEPRSEEPEMGPGGVDADPSESDVGAASVGAPVIPEGPLSAQQDQVEVPDSLGEVDDSEGEEARAADDAKAEEDSSEDGESTSGVVAAEDASDDGASEPSG